jgi:hypothetical protein
MQVRDRSNESFPGIVTQHGSSHVSTSDRAIAAAPGEITGDGGTSQQARIPSNRPYTEISQVEGEGENCSALTADQGGEAGEGHVNEAHKCASVASHPQLMASHRHSTITAKDHDDIHSGAETPVSIQMPMDNQSGPVPMVKDGISTILTGKAESSRTPATYQGGRQNFSNSTSRPIGTPMKSAGSGVVAEVGSKLDPGPCVYHVSTVRL